MGRVEPGTPNWGPLLNDDLDSIEQKAVDAIAAVQSLAESLVEIPDDNHIIELIIQAAIPGTAQYVQWDGTSWVYRGSAITSRPVATDQVRFIFLDFLGTSSWPSFALEGVDFGLKATS